MPHSSRFVVALSATAIVVASVGLAAGRISRPREDTGFERPTAAKVVRWIAVGGGSGPRSTQVSLEQDMDLARQTLGKDGIVLFAGGARNYGVQVLHPEAAQRGDRLLRELGDLFDPLDGRDATYRQPLIPADGAATSRRFIEALSAALAEGRDELLVYVAVHGEAGDVPADNTIRLWGDAPLSVRDLADVLDSAGSKRVVRFVVTSCYSGGFADLAFDTASAEAGVARSPRCGLFSTEWDREASGCDPNPNRAAQQGYGVHFWHALRGEDRSGAKLSEARIDFDGDGRVSFLEAHTRARIASSSIDVPTSTSERWLRHAAPGAGPESDVALPEEEALISALSADLGLAGESAARQRLQSVDAELAEADDALAKAERREMDASAALRMALLQKWPVIDDPWHPEFASTLGTHRAAIGALLREGPLAAEQRAAREDVDGIWKRVDALLAVEARLRRLVRAYETRALARRLRAAGGPAWHYFAQLLACERGRP
jgi:hypothetical protein